MHLASLHPLSPRLWTLAYLFIGCAPAKMNLEEEDADEDEVVLAEALPYSWETYEFPEAADDVACSGVGNEAALIEGVYLAQTHLMEPDWPFFYLVAKRPVLAEVFVTGSGEAPEVSITATADNGEIGTLCMDGPDTLSEVVDLETHKRRGRFTVTLPAGWVQPGLSLVVAAGDDSVVYEAETLDVVHAPEVNLVMVVMDVVNYNDGAFDIEPPATFLGELASALPASTTRFGRFPARLPLPTLALGGTGQAEGDGPFILDRRLCVAEESPATAECTDTTQVQIWDINASALRMIDALMRATGEFSTHFYFGNTEQLFPGGWGGGKTFVSADYEWVTIHEMGHAASLPHWGDTFLPVDIDDSWSYEYPWGGDNVDGGGRGPTWTYTQHLDEFVSPICQEDWNEYFGLERSDAMQRNLSCGEWRSGTSGPWDGFSDFSAYAMYRYLTGTAESERGTVMDPLGGEMAYNIPLHSGFPVVEWDAGDNPAYTRTNDAVSSQYWETLDFWIPQQRDIPVFTIYGTYHPGFAEANILYDPIRYEGSLPRVIDPTDPASFANLAAGPEGSYGDYFWWAKDLTFKITYIDGSVLHALYPYGSVDREWTGGVGPWRGDLLYFAINVPGDQAIEQIQLFERPFLVRYAEWVDEGNVANPSFGITADNFMDDAVEVMSWSR